jgi:hypothetical protein
MRLAALLIVCSFSAFAQQVKDKKWRISPLPVIYYSPETKLGFGALVSANVNFGDSTTQTSYLQTSVIYTTNKQYELSNIGRIYTNRNDKIFQYRVYYAYFPEYFYGYQTQTPDEFKELIDYKRLWIELKAFKKIRGTLYGGVFAKVNRLFDVHAIDQGSFESVAPPGFRGYTIGGIAPALTSDSRDSQVYPTSGHFIEASWMALAEMSGGMRFNNFRFDARTYRRIKWLKDDVVAFQFLLNLNEGTVPYRDMADVGGSETMRGYYRGYYRYKNLYASQVEYRFMIHKYIGFAVWAGGALVSERWSKPFAHSLKPNAGLGLRLRINQRDKLNLRGDYGVGRNQTGLYLDAAEAF